MNQLRPYGAILCIVAIAGILRFYQLGAMPPGLYWDEVAIGYNAYSILTTGKDEYGKRYPMSFRSFGDYKYPGYIYATAASMMLFGKSDFAVRFPSALAGTLTVLVTYFLVKELFRAKKKNRNRQPSVISHQSSVIALLAAFLLAVSPWHLQFSRGGFEANLALFFVVAGWWTFLLAQRTRGAWLALSVVFFVLGAATYISTRLFAPLILGTLILIYRKTVFKDKRKLSLAIATGVLTSIPFLPSIISGEAAIRAYSESIIGKEKLFPQVLENYLANFDTTFLFFRGDQNGRHSVRKLGMLYLFELPLLVVGFRSLLKDHGLGKRVTIAWLLLAPVSVSLSNINPHAIRSLHMLPAWEIIAAVGAISLGNSIGRYKGVTSRMIAYSMLSLAITYNVLLYLHQYFVHYPRETASDWQDGWRETIAIIENRRNQYDEVFVTEELAPIYLAFYLPIEPERFQQLERPITGIGNLHYFKSAWEIERTSPQKALIVAPYWQKPAEGTSYQEVKMLNGDTVFNIWED